MKVIFIFRQGFESTYILNKLKNIEYDYKVIIETGSEARSKKIERTFRNKNLFLKMLKIIDLIAMIIFMKFYEYYFKKDIAKKYLNNIDVDLVVSDVNDAMCLNFVKKNKADAIVVFGTAIIKKPFLLSVTSTIFNIHTGILPKYRNVHSDFWAYINGDINNIGISIIYLDEGIDSGDIALVKKVKVRELDNFFDIKIKVIKQIPNLLIQTLEKYQNESIIRKKQNSSKSNFYPTPGLREVLRLIFRN